MVEVHVATGTDADDVVELERRLFAEDSGQLDRHADVDWPARDGAQDFADLVANPDAIVFLARADGRAVGLLVAYATVAGATRKPVRSAVLRTMYVTTSDRRAGVGSALVAEFLDWAGRAGWSRHRSITSSPTRRRASCTSRSGS